MEWHWWICIRFFVKADICMYHEYAGSILSPNTIATIQYVQPWKGLFANRETMGRRGRVLGQCSDWNVDTPCQLLLETSHQLWRQSLRQPRGHKLNGSWCDIMKYISQHESRQSCVTLKTESGACERNVKMKETFRQNTIPHVHTESKWWTALQKYKHIKPLRVFIYIYIYFYFFYFFIFLFWGSKIIWWNTDI